MHKTDFNVQNVNLSNAKNVKLIHIILGSIVNNLKNIN